jgi:poly [ADP-ribose] polymerase 2/3/4
MIIREEKYIKSDVNKNNNKFWYAELHDNGDVITRWGRVGDVGQSKTFPGAGASFLDKKCREKESARNDEIPYRKLNVIETKGVTTTGSPTVKVADSRLAEVAKKQIKTNNPLVSRLIEYFAKVNAFQIMSATEGKITYNDTTGLFSTPLGIVTQSNIDEANDLLVKIGDMIARGQYDASMADITNSYCMLIPQNLGHKRLDVKDFWRDMSKVQYQKNILDSLQASLTTATSATAPAKTSKKDIVAEEKVFDCQIHLVEDGKEIDRVKRLYNKTRNSVHVSYNLDVKTIYTVDINTVREAFEKDGANMSNIWELYHGTKASSALSIIRTGLKMPSPSSTNVTGKMFSGRPGKEGLYFSDQSTKSLNYATNYWTRGGDSSRTFMFLAKVAMGNHFTPSGPRNDLPRPGYDSTFAKGNISGVGHNEMIVYRESQVNLTHLIEFTPNGK